MANEIKAGGIYYDIEAKSDKLKKDLQYGEDLAKKASRSMQAALTTRIQANLDTSLMKRKVSEVQRMHTVLKAKLAEKLKLNADIASITRTRAALEKVEETLKGVSRAAVKTETKVSGSFKNIAKNAFVAIGGLYALKRVFDFGNKIISTAGEFEALRERLVSLYGDADKAKDVFNQFKELAAKTPFSLRGVVTAGAQLKAFGLNAEKSLKSVADLAAFMGIDVVEAASAVGRAFAGGAGAADILRERGVLNLIKSIKGIDDLSKLTLPEFRKALLETMEDPAARIAGSTERMSKTFQGAMSNMGDAVETFAAAIGGSALSGIKNLVKQATFLIEALTPNVTALDEAREKAFQLSYEFTSLTSTYTQLRKQTKLSKEETELYKGTISKLQQQYPNYLKNVDLHKDKLEDIEKAFSSARGELDKYITSLLKQAAIEQQKGKIAELAIELGKYTRILYGLKNAQKEVNETGIDPFASLTPDQRFSRIEKGDITVEYRTANIFKGLDEQVVNVEKRITELNGQRDQITQTVKEMMDAFELSPTPNNLDPVDESVKATIVTIQSLEKELETLKNARAIAPIDSKEFDELTVKIYETEQQLKSLTKVTKSGLDDSTKAMSKYYETVKFEDQNYYKFRREMIEQEYNDFLAATNNKLAAERLRFEAMKGLEEEYQAWLANQRTKLSPVEKTEGPEAPKSDLQDYNEFMEKGNPFSGEGGFVNSVEAAIAAADGLVGGFFEDLTVKGKWANSVFEQAFAGMADAVIQQIQRMIAQWLAWQAVRAAFSLIGLPLPVPTPTGHQGGHFRGSTTGIKKMARGSGVKGFRVPGGYPNDTFPMFAETNEDIFVVPANKKGQYELVHKMSAEKFATGIGADFTQLNQKVVIPQTNNQTIKTDNLDRTLQTLTKRFDILGANLIDLNSSQSKMKIDLESRLEGTDIYLSNEKTSKRLGRMR